MSTGSRSSPTVSTATVGGVPVAADVARRRRRRQRRRRPGRRARRGNRARRRARGERPLATPRPRPLRVDRRDRVRRARQAATAGCSRRASTRTSESAAGRAKGPHLRGHLARLARAYGVDPAAITDVRGHRLPMRRLGASIPARDSVLLVGDAAGLVDPLSGDGMYEAFTSARLAAEAILAARRRAVRGDARAGARPPRGRLVGGEARARPPSCRLLLGGPLARRLRRRRRPAARGRRAPGRGEGHRAPAAAARRPRRPPRLSRSTGWCRAVEGCSGVKVQPLACRCSRRDRSHRPSDERRRERRE